MPNGFQSQLVAFAERTMRIKAHCAGEDATRIYLVMPFLELLGYDAGDPAVIVPEHEDSINFAVLVDRRPGIAIEATGAARPPTDTYDRLRSYCDTMQSVKLGIATNGMIYEAFIDSQVPDVLDAEPFLRIDLARVAAGEIDQQSLNLLQMMRAASFDPEGIAEQAFEIDLRDRIKTSLLEEFRNPSDGLCRLILEQIGIHNASPAVIDQHYRSILKDAMEQAIIVPVVQALRQLPAPAAKSSAPVQESSVPAHLASHDDRGPVDERFGEELAVFGRLQRRSA